VAHSIRWTNEEEARLKRLISRGRTQAQTAEILERTVVAIAQRASKLKYDPLLMAGHLFACSIFPVNDPNWRTFDQILGRIQ